MIIEELADLFARDLEKLRTEIALYKNHNRLWSVDKAISNSAGNLCLHLVGNLKTYIGLGIGKIDYVRNRDLEFSAKDISVSQLVAEIDETIVIVQKALLTLTAPDLEKEFPIVIWDSPTKMGFTLFHLLAHLNYHLGQINYHRRLLDD